MLQWLALGLVVVGYLGVYSAWTAGRAALDAQLRDRAEVARHVPALREAAEAALLAADHCASLSLERQPFAMVLGPEREQAENQLSRALRTVAPTD